MSDGQDQRSDVDRLDELKAQLSKSFGRLTKWKALCQERDVTTVEE
jgi:hypothetical protein